MLSSKEAPPEAVKSSGLIHRVHQPQTKAPYPTAVLVHGRAGNAQLMWTFSKALEEKDPLVVTPQAQLADEIGGWSWWSIRDAVGERKKRTSAEDLLAAHKEFAGFLDSLPELYGADQNNKIAFGFSQGGAVISSYALRFPMTFRAVALLASFIPSVVFEDPQLIAEEVRSKQVKLPAFLILHGSEDKTISLEMAERARDNLVQLGAEVEFHVDPVGHKVGTEGMRVLKSWVSKIW